MANDACESVWLMRWTSRCPMLLLTTRTKSIGKEHRHFVSNSSISELNTASRTVFYFIETFQKIRMVGLIESYKFFRESSLIVDFMIGKYTKIIQKCSINTPKICIVIHRRENEVLSSGLSFLTKITFLNVINPKSI